MDRRPRKEDAVRLRRTGSLVADSPQDEGCPQVLLRITGRPSACRPSGRAEGRSPSALLIFPHDGTSASGGVGDRRGLRVNMETESEGFMATIKRGS